jgi:hypothetical protein
VALFWKGMPCAICTQTVNSERPFFATSGVWLSSSDPLSKYCDTVLHWSCYAGWEHRRRFAHSYFQMWVELEKENPVWWRVYLDDSILVTASPSLMEAIHVELAETGTRQEVEMKDWAKWLAAGDEPGMHPIESEAIRKAKEVLRSIFPTVDSVLARIDPDSKTELFKRREQAAEQEAERAREKQKFIAHDNRTTVEYHRRIVAAGFSCPSCGNFSKDYRLSVREGCPSLIICRACGDTIKPPAE